MKERAYSIEELARLINAQIEGSFDSSVLIKDIAPIAHAGEGEITYCANTSYRKHLSQSRATAIILSKEFVNECKGIALVVANPEAAFVKIAKLFDTRTLPPAGIHATAVIGKNCKIADSVFIGPQCVIGNNVSIGAKTVVMAGSIIGDDTHIGDDCILYSHVTLYDRIVIHNRVVINSGAVIGADGFGYAREGHSWVKIPQMGSVLIEDDVEIGANTAIDRGAIRDTIIRKGVKIDNLVQIGHNVEIGEHTIIAGCTAIAGSAKIGRGCMIGGGCRLNGHVSIGDGVMLAGATVTLEGIEQPGAYASAINAAPIRQWMKTIARIHQLDDLHKRVKQLERQNEHANEQS